MALENENFSFSEILFSQLWRTLARKIMKRPVVFIRYFLSSSQIAQVYEVLESIFFKNFVTVSIQYPFFKL